MGSRSAGPLLVATDASGAADGAIRVAKAIAQRAGQPIYILAVHPPMPILSAEIAIAEGPNTEAENRRYLREQVLEQLKRVGVEAEWPLDVVTGDPAATIVSVAQGIGASLVIMGLGGHGLFDRLLGDETVLRVLRLGTVPVLAVAPDAIGLPRNALAAIDFSASCERAASLAADIMSPDGRLTLIHVVTREDDKAHLAIHHSAYDGILGHGFDLLTADIGFEAVEQIDRRVLSGDPAKVLLDLADAMTPDLIVAGSHGHRFLTRLLLGSVSQRLVRGARCSVLVAPPADAPSYLQELPRVSEGFASYAWAERLEEFTRRNAGRTSALEVIEPDLGAQVEHRGLAFRGASFDPRDGQVHLMFGELGSEKAPAHLTRRIGGVTAIQVLRDRECQDMLLRIAHGRGQTLLTLVR
ncbi:MAG TPA: universal stress protein [Gemmatimonadaceae bacterium]|nr:universal stress protein [Gemmatimonadaceae bacterium]